MFAIIYTGKKLPSCNNEFFMSIEDMQHACDNRLLAQINQSIEVGVSPREIEDGSFRTVIHFGTPTMAKTKAIFEAMDLVVMIHQNEFATRQMVFPDGLTQQGNILCPELTYFAWPSWWDWKQAFESGWQTKNFTMHASLK